MEELGFIENRANIEKFRRMYEEEEVVFTIHTFPENMGTFLEIEAPTQEELLTWTRILFLEEFNLDKRDYGEIIRHKKSELLGRERRISFFSQIEKKSYRKQVGNQK